MIESAVRQGPMSRYVDGFAACALRHGWVSPLAATRGIVDRGTRRAFAGVQIGSS
jgi:hypothetical protein